MGIVFIEPNHGGADTHPFDGGADTHPFDDEHR